MHVQYYIEILFMIFTLGAIVFMILFSIKLRSRSGEGEVVDEKKWFTTLIVIAVIFNVATLH